MLNTIYCEISARSKVCRARLYNPVDDQDPRHFILKGTHSHAGDARKVGKKKVMQKMKELSQNTKQPIRQVISESIAGVKKATAAKLPNEKVMARMISRYRRNPGVPKNPQSFSELKFPEEYRMTLKKQPFLLYDSFDIMEIDGEDTEFVRDRMLIFTTKDNLSYPWTIHGRNIFCDTGTVQPTLYNPW